MTPDDPTDERLAAALGAGASYERAAAIAACSRATVKRRMGDPTSALASATCAAITFTESKFGSPT